MIFVKLINIFSNYFIVYMFCKRENAEFFNFQRDCAEEVEGIRLDSFGYLIYRFVVYLINF